MILPQLNFAAPSSLEEACTLLNEAGGEGCVLAGGTDLIVKMKRGLVRPRLVVSLRKLEKLTQISSDEEGTLSLGSHATMADLERHEMLRSGWTALAEGASLVGGPLIRNRATVGGNIISARPCADTVSPLIACGARLVLASRTKTRRIDLEDFITGPGQTLLSVGEILTAIEIPALVKEQAASREMANAFGGSSYQTITRKSAMEVTLVGCAAWLTLDKSSEKIVRARLVLTSVASTLVRARKAETLLEGRAYSAELLREAAELAQDAAKPIDDHRAPADYRKEMVVVLTRRALEQAYRRAKLQVGQSVGGRQ